MNNLIRTYEDLLNEQTRLKNKLHLQGEQIKVDVEEIKTEIRPAINVLSFIGKFANRESRNNLFLEAGTSLSIDWLAKKFLSKNFLASMLLPPVIKNISSHLLHKAKNILAAK